MNPHRAGPVTRAPSNGLAEAGRWLTGGAVLVGAAVWLAWISWRFGYGVDPLAKPVLAFTAGLCVAGLAFVLVVPGLVRSALSSPGASGRAGLTIIFLAGLLARLVLFASTPVLEDDFYRYLWDGAVTVQGHNPYATAPIDGAGLVPPSAEATQILDRVGYADLRTIYPPVAQLGFALAYYLDPWGLTGWRALVLLCDVVSFGLLARLLASAGRSPLWSALYWWNPLVIATAFNGAHMDVLVLPPVLLALWLAIRGSTVSAAASLAIAIGVKIWPVLLLPLLLRPVIGKPKRALAALVVVTIIVAVLAVPILLAGLDSRSGFVAYAQSWQRNSALFPLVEQAVSQIAGAEQAPLVSRALLALVCVMAAFGAALQVWTTPADLMRRATFVVAVVILAAPAAYPWYFTWLAPLLAFQPSAGLLLLTAMLPLYYSAFHFAARQNIGIFNSIVVWIIWVPVWVLLVREVCGRGITAPDQGPADAQPTQDIGRGACA